MIEVYNVGQGDSFLLKPNGNCSFSNNPILIDCGNADQNVYRKIKHTININNVLITHSDNDHIGGLEGVITNKNITKLYVPYYLPEIIAVLNYFEKKSSRKIKPLLESIMNKINIHMLKEGDPLCSHIVILNPAIEHDIFKNISVSNQELQQAIENLNQTLNISLDEKEILEYESDVLQYLDTNTKGEYQENSKAFVHKFIYRLNLMVLNSRYTMFNNRYPLSNIKKKIKYDANKFSIVLKYQDANISYLFTGDVDTTVFNRIIKDDKYCLRADILKVPHHGSCYNLNQSIINRINPKYAIISHENKHGHPSEEIIKILEINRTQVFLTNDIKKVTTLIASTKQTIGAVASNEIVFI